MTKQILLKTPRGNTAVISVDHFVSKARASSNRMAAEHGAGYEHQHRPTLAFSAGEERASSFSPLGGCCANGTSTSTTALEEEAAAIRSAVDTSRIFEDGDNDRDADRQSKEELLFHLIGASKRRDVGRKRTLRSVYNLEVEGEEQDDRMGMGMEPTDADMDIDDVHVDVDTDIDDHSSSDSSSSDSSCGYGDREQKAVANRFDEMTIHRNNPHRFKSRRQFYSHSFARSASASASAFAATSTRRRQRHDPTCSREREREPPGQPTTQGRPSGQAMAHESHCAASPSFSPSPSPAPSPPPLMVAFYHQGRKVSLDRIWDWITQSSDSTNSASDTNTNTLDASSSTSLATTSRTRTEQSSSTVPQFPLYLTLSTSVRLLGGIDRQNRVGSKFGGGGVSSSQNAERERKERLKQLALESIDLAKDPYLMRNHLGTYECKLCLTLHTNEANYLAHTQGKKHQAGLAKRAHMEKLRNEREEQMADRNHLKRPPPAGSPFACQPATIKVPRIGRPAYQVFKSKDPETSQRCLTFELTYKDIKKDLQPRHRFMSAFEQKVDLPRDKRYQYVLFAAEPYETIAFKIPNEPLDRDPGRLVTHWDEDDKKFTVTLYFEDGTSGEEKETEADEAMDTGGVASASGGKPAFAPALLGGR